RKSMREARLRAAIRADRTSHKVAAAAFAGFLFTVVATTLGRAKADEPPAALTVRLVRPDEQLKRVVSLFEGTRSPHPPAALAAWKHARGRAATLGKPIEAVIALFNPTMVDEVRSLDDAEFRLTGFEPDTGRIRWRAMIPGDDGSLNAFAT